jgi:hypothetical protein
METKNFQNKSDRHWRTVLKELYANECLITGVSTNSGSHVQLTAHHLYSKKEYPSLELNFLNGVVLLESFHKDYHKKYGYSGKLVTPQTFKEYLLYLKNKSEYASLKNRLMNALLWIQTLEFELEPYLLV